MRALLVTLTLLSSASALAQPAVDDLGGGWSARSLDGALSGARGLACSDAHAYVRNHTGRVGRVDATTVEVLPRIDATRGVYGIGVDVTPSGTVTVVGGGTFARLDHDHWARFELPVRSSGEGLLALDDRRSIVPADGAVVGVEGDAARSFDAGTWRSLEAADGVASDLWVVGQGGVAMHWTGSWAATSVGRDAWLRGVQRVAANDVWAWGPGVYTGRGSPLGGVFHWDGARWTERSVADRTIRGLTADASTALAVEAGAIHRWNGAGWDQVLTAETRSLGMACHTRSHAFVLDEQGAILFRTWP